MDHYITSEKRRSRQAEPGIGATIDAAGERMKPRSHESHMSWMILNTLCYCVFVVVSLYLPEHLRERWRHLLVGDD